MGVHQFTSESYSESSRLEAWQDILGALGVRSTIMPAAPSLQATAFHRASADGVVVALLAAGAQTLSPLGQGTGLPLALISLEDGAVLKTAGSHHPLPAGSLAILPRQGVGTQGSCTQGSWTQGSCTRGSWTIDFKRRMQAVALSVASAAFHGRKIGAFAFGNARVVPAGGLASVIARVLEETGQGLETLSPPEWNAISQSLAQLLLTLLRRSPAMLADVGGTTTQSALLHRICEAIERMLDDPDLTPACVAQAEGISERYLQKLFEGTGDNFTRYVRRRRLHRTWTELSNPDNGSQSVSEIAYRCGFNDAAHFSKVFRERFGVSPREFRRQEFGRLTAFSGAQSQRGWPQKAQLRARRSGPGALRATVAGAGSNAAVTRIRPESRHHHLPASAAHVHWGFFSHALKPVVEIMSGDTITVETLTQHASDDPERMIHGDASAESVFHWTRETKTVDRRGAGPMDASIYGRGAGEGFGVHICAGPIAVKDAQPGDVLEVRILDIVPRPSRNPAFAGRVFGSSAATWWGYHYGELISEPKPRETVTIFEIVTTGDDPHARAVYSYRWAPQTDPFGVVHKAYDYPGVLVAPGSVERQYSVLDGVRIPLRPHFGVIGVAPREADLVDSVPPSYFGGNIDNWRLGKGAAVYLPVSVPGALLSVGDPHAAQGDGELGGTAIECSMTGTFKVVLHKRVDLPGQPFADVTYPLIETEDEWVLTGFSHPNYLAEFGAKGQSEVYATSSLDLAMKDAFRKVRRFLMKIRGLTEDEAIALISTAVDFSVTQVVDGNWGVHAILSKRLFASETSPS
jgi:acetamidase/formamidase/AraC-like DNA-binding protein